MLAATPNAATEPDSLTATQPILEHATSVSQRPGVFSLSKHRRWAVAGSGPTGCGPTTRGDRSREGAVGVGAIRREADGRRAAARVAPVVSLSRLGSAARRGLGSAVGFRRRRARPVTALAVVLAGGRRSGSSHIRRMINYDSSTGACGTPGPFN